MDMSREKSCIHPNCFIFLMFVELCIAGRISPGCLGSRRPSAKTTKL